MTGDEWLTCGDPLRLVKALRQPPARKRELFACACCRRAWPRLTDPRSRRLVEAAERFVEGRAPRNELLDAAAAASAVEHGYRRVRAAGCRVPDYTAGVVARCCLGIADGRCNIADVSNNFVACSDDIPAEWEGQSHLIRCVFGNPFRPVTFSPDWLTPTVTAVARQAHESQDFSALPILADALQDAGCDSDDVLDHCRGPGPHARGCWVVDALLGKD